MSELTERQKGAYRYLLYWAMLDIRNKCQSRGKETLNPLEWRQQYRESRVAGAIADWLHNLASYSASDFRGFDEDWFWREYESMCRRWAGNNLEHYRDAYARRLVELTTGRFQSGRGLPPRRYRAI